MITIEASGKPQPIDVDLIGKRYRVVPPKAALALRMVADAKQAQDGDPSLMVDSLMAWIDGAFGKKQAADIRKRLDDPGDLLDIQHIAQLMRAVMEHVTTDPTM